MKSIWEYVVHPFNAFQKVWGYHRDPDVRYGSERERRYQDQHRRKYNWLSEYFERLYDLNRVHLYAMYKEIDQDPLLSAVLDIYAEVATQPNTESGRDEAGRVMWVHCPNPDVRRILTRFLDTIEIDSIAATIIRSLNQYGDHFEGIPGARNDGVIRFDPYDPWEVGVVKDSLGRVCGYGEADDQGDVTNRDKIIPYYRMLHFHMPFKHRVDWYGAKASLFYNARDWWQEFQWVQDKVMIERLQRRPPRMALQVDITGMSMEEGMEACKEWQEYLYRDVYFDPDNSILRSLPAAWGEQRDVVIPTGGDSKTSISTLPGSSASGALDDLEFFLRRLFGALRFPPAYLGLELGSITRDAPLPKQDVAFAQNAMRGQRAFIQGMVVACMFHLAWHNIDPKRDENRFLLMMSPVSTFEEVERKELVSMRLGLMDEALRFGKDLDMDDKMWTRYVLTEYGHMQADFVEKLLAAKEEVPKEEGGGDDFGFEGTEHRTEYQKLMEELKDDPRASSALTFFKGGCSMASSGEFPGDFEVSESEDMSALTFRNPKFQQLLEERMRRRAKARAAIFSDD